MHFLLPMQSMKKGNTSLVWAFDALFLVSSCCGKLEIRGVVVRARQKRRIVAEA